MHNKAAAITVSQSLSSASVTRLDAIDIQRGFIMTLMALSHCQEYIGIERYSNDGWDESSRWLGTSLFELLHQIFVSMMVTGGFFLMMGMGIIFLWEARLKQGWPIHIICRYLITRGSVLIFLQATILQLFEIIAERKLYFYVGVLFALGACMIAASLVLYVVYKYKQKHALRFMHIQYSIPILIIICILFVSHMVTRNLLINNSVASAWQVLLLLGGTLNVAGIEVNVNFTPLPWFAAVAFGLILGQIVHRYKKHTFRILAIFSILFLSSWALVRLAHINQIFSLGEYKIFLPNENPELLSLFCMSKYPPSLSYFLWSFGVNLACIVLFNQVQKYAPLGPVFEALKTFGRSALFFFVTHWFVFYGLSLIMPKNNEPVLTLFVVWVLGLIMLYVMCLAYNQFKIKKSKDSIWRMF